MYNNFVNCVEDSETEGDARSLDVALLLQELTKLLWSFRLLARRQFTPSGSSLLSRLSVSDLQPTDSAAEQIHWTQTGRLTPHRKEWSRAIFSAN
jgi:hypothetical protein